MAKLSPRYRQDSADGLDSGMREYLDKEYFAKLDHLDKQNPKVLVVFAGGNAVGKSTLASRLSSEFQGLHLENDGVKRTILAKFPEQINTDKLHQKTWQYTMGLYQRLGGLTPNGLAIRDGIITWYFDRILPVFERQGYHLFIVGYDLSEEKARELIDARGDTSTSTAARFHELIEDHKVHQQRFTSEYTPDIVLTDDTVFDHDAVVFALSEKLNHIMATIGEDN